MQYTNRVKTRKLKVKSLGVAALLAFIFSLSTLSAQESVNATGGNASGSGGTASYSVGQVAYQTHTGTNGSVAEGVQQPYEISVVTGIEEAKSINLSVTAYPNPTSDYLTLNIDEFDISNVSYQLYDMQGKLLQSEKITDNQTSIFMKDLAPAIYFVRVIVKTQGLASQEVKTFKIIKTQ
ncbi:MAG: T9SS C-terminal target domain-containing protein [Bacteroidetes bacterium]|nr:MAG: T9SS C-terminal target domain-containing protein [Bacteroidota bacterium]